MGKSCGHSPLSDDSARKLLGGAGLNRTKIKVQLLMELSRSHHPLSVNDLHAKLRKVCDVSTIFRTVSQFKDKELVREVNLDEGFFRYEMAIHQDGHGPEHHHHVRCRKCGDIRQLGECDLKGFEKALMSLGFTHMEHRLEFTALCSHCS